jgi:hypothetical protein
MFSLGILHSHEKNKLVVQKTACFVVSWSQTGLLKLKDRQKKRDNSDKRHLDADSKTATIARISVASTFATDACLHINVGATALIANGVVNLSGARAGSPSTDGHLIHA